MFLTASIKKIGTLIDIATVGIDLAKYTFQLHRMDARGEQGSPSKRSQMYDSVSMGVSR